MATMSAADELDQLLEERFGLDRADLIAALRTLPAIRPWAASLSEGQARLLDESGFTEDPQAYRRVAADTVAQIAVLITTAYSAAEVADALGVNGSRVRQRRIARTLWAIEDNGAWVFPALQFDRDNATGRPRKQIRGLDRVFAALPADLHPVAVAGFLRTSQADLQINGRPETPLRWLRSGGDVEAVLRVVEVADWAGR